MRNCKIGLKLRPLVARKGHSFRAQQEGLHRTAEWFHANPECVRKTKSGEYPSCYERFYANRQGSLPDLRREAAMLRTWTNSMADTQQTCAHSIDPSV